MARCEKHRLALDGAETVHNEELAIPSRDQPQVFQIEAFESMSFRTKILRENQLAALASLPFLSELHVKRPVAGAKATRTESK